MHGDVRDYLIELSDLVRNVEQGRVTMEDAALASNLGIARAPLTFGLPNLEKEFGVVAEVDGDAVATNTFIFVHDTETNEIIREDKYNPTEREEALSEYERISRELDPVRFDVLILNCADANGIKVTHPRLFSVL